MVPRGYFGTKTETVEQALEGSCAPPLPLRWDCAPKFDPVNGSIDATLAGVEALRFEISERGLVAYA